MSRGFSIGGRGYDMSHEKIIIQGASESPGTRQGLAAHVLINDRNENVQDE